MVTRQIISRVIVLRHSLKKLKQNGLALALVPIGFMFKSGRTGKVIKSIVMSNMVEAVIELLTGIIPGTMTKVTVVLFNKNKKNSNIYMINAADLYTKTEKIWFIYQKKTLN